MAKEHKKYSEAELIFGGLGLLMVDGSCLLIDLTMIGAVITPVIQTFFTFALTEWAKSKGDKNSQKMGRQITKYASNALPVLPTLFTMFLIEALIHNNPKLAQVVSKKVPGAAIPA